MLVPILAQTEINPGLLQGQDSHSGVTTEEVSPKGANTLDDPFQLSQKHL